jgi:hypothetical protein
MSETIEKQYTRRDALKIGGAAAFTALFGGSLSGCSSENSSGDAPLTGHGGSSVDDFINGNTNGSNGESPSPTIGEDYETAAGRAEILRRVQGRWRPIFLTAKTGETATVEHVDSNRPFKITNLEELEDRFGGYTSGGFDIRGNKWYNLWGVNSEGVVGIMESTADPIMPCSKREIEQTNDLYGVSIENAFANSEDGPPIVIDSAAHTITAYDNGSYRNHANYTYAVTFEKFCDVEGIPENEIRRD